MSTSKETSLPQQLLWLADAPSFIDGSQIERFYDAVVRPAWRQGAVTRKDASNIAGEIAAELGIKGEVDAGSLLQLLSTWLPSMKASAEGKVSLGGDIEVSKLEEIELLPIVTPQRQLEQLAIHYHLFQNERLSAEMNPLDDLESKQWPDEKWIQALPRGLVLLDLPPGTMFIPTYGEYGEQNTPGLVFLKLEGGHLRYPDAPDEQDKREYWKYFADNFKVQTAVQALESSGTGKLEVVDFRVPISEDGRTLHLHIHPRGEYPTITFAYNLIRRGFEHGVRLVGTMRSEPDMNVLAIYEK